MHFPNKSLSTKDVIKAVYGTRFLFVSLKHTDNSTMSCNGDQITNFRHPLSKRVCF